MNTFFIFAANDLFILPIIIIGIYFLYQPRSSQKRMAIWGFIALVATYLVGRLAGHFYFDPRPFVVNHFTPLIPHAPNNGFPSDHALLVSAIAMLGTIWNRKLGIVLWIVAAIVAFARVYVGVHHPIDVIGSAIISIIVVSFVYFLYKRFWPNINRI